MFINLSFPEMMSIFRNYNYAGEYLVISQSITSDYFVSGEVHIIETVQTDLSEVTAHMN